jgi:hypothetical protein
MQGIPVALRYTGFPWNPAKFFKTSEGREKVCVPLSLQFTSKDLSAETLKQGSRRVGATIALECIMYVLRNEIEIPSLFDRNRSSNDWGQELCFCTPPSSPWLGFFVSCLEHPFPNASNECAAVGGLASVVRGSLNSVVLFYNILQ